MQDWHKYFDPSSGPVDYSCVYDIKFNGNARNYIKQLVQSNHWPMQVKPEVIVTSPEAEKKRAQDIINQFFGRSIKGKKLLDFGAGNATLVDLANSMGINALAFDLVDPRPEGVTNNIDEILDKGPYDHILLYDVIDHLSPAALNVQMTLSLLKACMRPGSMVHVRAHPFITRHAMHTYHKLNKAFVHLFLTNKELEELGYDEKPLIKIMDPYSDYLHLFTSHGFKVHGVKYITHPVESFFLPLLPFMKHNYNHNVPEDSHILKCMTVAFVDMVLLVE